MKRFYTILMATMLTLSAFAQHRYHPINLTDVSAQDMSILHQHRLGTRESASIPCTGSPKIPVILVQFSDMAFVSDTIWNKTIEHSDENVNKFYERFCNGSGIEGEDYRNTIGSVGPVRDYFSVSSDGQFTPEFVVIGPVTLSKSWQYYGKDNSAYSKDVNLSEFYKEAIKLATEQGVDWTIFDNNKDSKIDFVFFLYAGEGQNAYGTIKDIEDDNAAKPDKQIPLEKANLIWPSEQQSQFTIGDKTFGGMGCTNELFNERTDGIGTMCHELSHGLGLPDLYDTSYKAFGLDYWDLMDAGNYCCLGRCPCEYNTYERDFMGWRKLEEISTTEPQTITLEPVEKGGKGYKFVNSANPNEYYIFENRQQLGYDHYYGWVSASYLKQYGANNGLIIFHVDYYKSAWTGNRVNTSSTHQRFTILPADGELISSIYGYGDNYLNSMSGDLYPGSQNVTSIESNRFNCYTGSNLPVEITNIRQNEDLSITLDVNGGDPTAIEEIVTNKSITAIPSMYYDLSGRPVLKPNRGIYLKDGKKVFVK